MIRISGLFVYPVKSCRGISLTEAELGPRGFLHDREFLVVDEHDAFITQRNASELATVQISLEENGLRLRTADIEDLRVSFDEMSERTAPRKVTIFSDQVLANDAGEEAADWFSGVLRRSCRLVRIGAAYSRIVPAERIATSHRATTATEVSFTDAFPTLLVSEESLADLNTRLPVPIPMDRFRPNIVVSGCEPYEENTWEAVRSNEIVFGCAATCLRCVVTSIDQQTGTRDGVEPLRTLATYRRSPNEGGVIFGTYLVHSGPAKLRVGDQLEVTPRAES